MKAKLAEKRKIGCDGDAGEISYMDLLPPGKRLALHKAIEDAAAENQPDAIVDLEASPAWRGRLSSITPCLVANSELYSVRAARMAAPKEYMLMQGLPVYPISCGSKAAGSEANVGAATTVPFECPFGEALEQVSSKEITSMAGNAMHISVVGHLLGYMIATSHRVTANRPVMTRTCSFDDGLSGGIDMNDSTISWEEALRSGGNRHLKAFGNQGICVATAVDEDDI